MSKVFVDLTHPFSAEIPRWPYFDKPMIDNAHTMAKGGVLTQRIIGIYHYEGEGLNYTLTAGNRSITEPMAPDVQDEAIVEETTETENALLYAGVGVFVVAVAAVAVILTLKKKKAGKPAEKAAQE